MQGTGRLTDATHVAALAGDTAHGAGRVLAVEDDEAIRRLVREVLRTRGYEVFEAADGEGALAAAHACRPHTILLDVGLPGVDGFDVLDRLKSDPALADVPVLMVTAWADPKLVRHALDRGAHDYVRKPFAIDELRARVDAACRLKAPPRLAA